MTQARKLTIPDAALARHIAVLGETGAGKTHDTKVIVEHLVDQGYRVCVLDTIKSDWWGMISSASGKRAGLPFRIIGGPRGHVPLHAGAGKPIGELVAKGKLPLSIIDMADFEAGEPQQFFEEFARAIWRNIKGVLYLVIEEAHEIAPKERAGFGKENMAVYWAKKLATGSRSKGIRLIVASQRTQAVHNALLGACGTMIAHSLSLPADQAPVIDWLKASLKDKDLRATIENDLSFLPTGTAWVCCAKERFFEKVAFPKIVTFDNSATPDKDAEDFDVATAAVDPEELRAIIGDAVKEAEANDPKTLQAEVKRLTAELAKANSAKRQAEAPSVNKTSGQGEKLNSAALAQARREGAAEVQATIPALLDAQHEQSILTGYQWALIDVRTTIKDLGTETAPGKADMPARKPLKGSQNKTFTNKVNYASNADTLLPASSQPKPIPVSGGNYAVSMLPPAEGLSRPQQRILDALAWLESVGIGRADRPRAAMLADASHKSSGFEKNVSTLRTGGYISYPDAGALALTAEGRAIAHKPTSAPTTAELHAAVRSHVSGPQWALLAALCAVYPGSLSREELAQQANVSHLSSGFEKNVSTLRSFGFVDYPEQGRVVATPIMFVGAP